MRMIGTVVGTLLVSTALASCCWAQRGAPAPRAAPAPHGPAVHPGAPHHDGSRGSGFAVEPAVIVVTVVGLLVGIVGLVFSVRAWRNRTIAHLRILATPPGEAPEEIRRAWVGVELPLRRGQTEPHRYATTGVLSGADPEATTGYTVDGRAAVPALASQAPEAAAWWRANAPHVARSGYRLVFPAEVCERVE